MAWEKGLACPDCGASEPVPKDEVRAQHPGGGAGVAMGCENCEGASEMTLEVRGAAGEAGYGSGSLEGSLSRAGYPSWGASSMRGLRRAMATLGRISADVEAGRPRVET
jgi:hypothetical protein